MSKWKTEELIAADPPSVAAATYGVVLYVDKLI